MNATTAHEAGAAALACDSAAIQHEPDDLGRFGAFGGRFVPETLIHALQELTLEYDRARLDPAFQDDLDGLLRDYVGRPSPLFLARSLSRIAGGASIYLKREDLNHTGAHKINNALGQALLAVRMGKRRIIAETGQASTEWPQPLPARFWASSAWFIWAKRTSAGRS